ncbi:hypothetical protein GTA08_BOTSDO01207 [Botryosphaeria dothidea]|uniref:Sulphur transport domain-containing protein n=1 Tax=Botryosphaeria dothidea TaxID=55169 RepID=A0A8H4NAD6_9PEZI|nr:hypothetical protein GTA08_BOTSDO01207 [Botryosphaeria dothidea]
MSSIAGEFTAGALFGSALSAAGIYSPALIRAQMHLADFTMLKIFVAASASGALAVHLADRLSFAPIKPRVPRYLGLFTYDGNLIGGALLGMGMALTGACPGTSLVQMASGLRSGLYVVLGGVAGGLAHLALSPILHPKRDDAPTETTPLNKSASTSSAEEPTLQGSFGLSTNVLLLAWEVMCVLFIQLANTLGGDEGSGAGLVTPIVGGCMIGGAQAATVLLTRHTIGVSTAYENAAQAIYSVVGLGGAASRCTPSLVFAAGILSSSALVTRAAPQSAIDAIVAGSGDVSAVSAFFGGLVMVFGARVAGGCTSGHGISGLVTFSWASFVSVAAMFGSGILTAFFLG